MLLVLCKDSNYFRYLSQKQDNLSKTKGTAYEGWIKMVMKRRVV